MLAIFIFRTSLNIDVFGTSMHVINRHLYHASNAIMGILSNGIK
jgi:hypothetical protein